MAEPILPFRRESTWEGVLYVKLVDAFHLYIAICLSEQLVYSTILGGALYLAGQVLVVFARLYSKRNSTLLPVGIQARGLALFLASALLCVCLLLVYPALTGHEHFIALLICIGLLLLRQGVTTVMAQRLLMKRTWRIVLLLAVHTTLSAAVAGVLAPRVTAEAFHEIITMVVATGVVAFAYQAVQVPHKPVRPAADADKLHRVSAYRIYNRMTSSTIVALNLALLTYICYMRIKPENTMLDLFWGLAAWLLLVGGMTALTLLFLHRKEMTRLDKPTVFVVGALLLFFAIIGAYRQWFSGWMSVLSYLLWGAGLACMLSIILGLGQDMQAVLELDMKPAELAGYRDNTQAMVEWSLTLSTLLLLLMLTIVTFASEGRPDGWETMPALRVLLRSIFLWPPVFIGIALLYALMQPLDKDYTKKLAHYRAQQRAGKVNPALKTHLQMKLIQQSRRIAPSVLRALIRPLMPCRVAGAEHVDTEHGPVVFVCNHLEVYGPLITNLHLPFYFRSWVVASMLDREIVAKHLNGGVESLFRWIPERLRTRLPRLFAPLVLFVLHSLDPIPVYRGTARDVVKTMRLTVDAMEYEDNILLFPENPGGGKYQTIGISGFYSGFAAIGSEYYKRTGNCTTFYPMYADKSRRTLTIGHGVTFNPDNGRAEEKERIVGELYSWMSKQTKSI